MTSAPPGPFPPDHRSALPRLPLLLALFTLSGLLACAQSARWEPSSGTLARDQASVLALVFSDAEPRTTPRPPPADGIEFLGQPGRSEQSSFTLGTGTGTVRRRTITYTYTVRPTRPDGEVRIPAFSVETDVGRIEIPPAGFTVAAATLGSTGLRLDQVAEARLEIPSVTVWAGEVFMLRHVLEVARDRAFRSDPNLEWTESPPLLHEAWDATAQRSTTQSSPPRVTETRTARALVREAGTFTLPALRQPVVIATGTDLFGRPVGDQFTVGTRPTTLRAKPLPTPAPADFLGAIGTFKLSSQIVPEHAEVGEPVTWTLTLEGTGNWPQLDRLLPRTVPGEFRVVSPRAQKTTQPERLFDATLSEDLVLIPQKPGRYILGPYQLSIFDPVAGAYRTLQTEPITLEVTPSTTAAPGRTIAAPNDPTASDFTPTVPATTPAPPHPPAPLPPEPTAPGRESSTPLENWPGIALLVGSLVPLGSLLLWLGLAARHARRHDPLRPQREAHTELERILTRLATGPIRPDDLLAWQHAVRARFALPAAAPSARNLPDPIWAALWIETERALYRPDTPLDPTWHAQAADALRRATLPPRPRLAALRPVHLFARATCLATIGALIACTPPSLQADPLDDYAKGNFAAAEKAWRTELEKQPADPALRQNLALALAQQGRFGEAAAHAESAALLAPRSPEAHRLRAALAPRAPYRLPDIPTPARLLSVRTWQLLALGAIIGLLGLTPSLYLLALHSPIRTRRRLSGFAYLALTASAALLTSSWLAIHAHGTTAHPRAVLVFQDTVLRAVPTEAGDQKIIADLPAGTVALTDREFLGWRRLKLPDGNSGWTRADTLVGLWTYP